MNEYWIKHWLKMLVLHFYSNTGLTEGKMRSYDPWTLCSENFWPCTCHIALLLSPPTEQAHQTWENIMEHPLHVQPKIDILIKFLSALKVCFVLTKSSLSIAICERCMIYATNTETKWLRTINNMFIMAQRGLCSYCRWVLLTFASLQIFYQL